MSIGTYQPDVKFDINGQIKIQCGNPGTCKVLHSNINGLCEWVDINSTGIGDNLGNHTSTQTLNMDVNDIDFVHGQSSRIHIFGEMSFDRKSSGSYDNPQYHGIQSKNESGNWSNDDRINSYNDVVIRLDGNNNKNTSYFKVQHHSTTDGSDLFWVRSSYGYAYINGRTGICTKPPSNKLHVKGDARLDGGYYNIECTSYQMNVGLAWKSARWRRME